eukprot:TRINITY_DN4245_c0_g1_i1.p1 TRINITY_DN4245_c0_g1~~TRINITY_DN4245_c0_g1_i1.p1  ORF type:complete len:453 (+),score=115.33 TRINITY_DN4245_c0_g1_i1:64-1422(+)
MAAFAAPTVPAAAAAGADSSTAAQPGLRKAIAAAQLAMQADPLATSQGCKGFLALNGALGTYASTLPPGHAGIKNGSYFCDPLHGPGAARQDVKKTALGKLLGASAPQLAVPPFQRRYCWTAALVSRWFNDGAGKLTALVMSPPGHACGKVIVAPAPAAEDRDMLVLIDGQQRLITTMLVVSAVRHAALEARDRLPPGALQSISEAADAVVCRRPRSAPFAGEGPPPLSACAHLSVVPTLADRRDFLAVTASELPTAAEGGGEPSPIMAAYWTLRECAASRLIAGDPATAASNCLSAIHSAQHEVSCIRVQLGSSKDLPQVFLWLEEKELYIDKMLYNPRKGLTHRSADLARNLFLAPLLTSTSPEEQEEAVKRLWLPLEHRGPEALSKLLMEFAATLERKKEKQAGMPEALADYYTLSNAVKAAYQKEDAPEMAGLSALYKYAESRGFLSD